MPRKPAQSNPAVGIVPVVRNEVVPLVRDDSIQSLILTVRGAPVLLDRDLAMLYGVPTKALNQAVKRNAERFPPDFMFQLTREECSRSQIVTMNAGRGSNLKYLPYAFTENGVAMLSGVLRSSTAVEVNIRIMRAFVAMRRFLVANAEVFRRIETVEHRQTATDAKVDAILARLDSGEPPPQGLFFDGQLWDACSLVERLVARAKASILLIDSWVGPGTLDMLAKKRTGVAVEIVTSPNGRVAASDVAKFNAQYPTLSVRVSGKFHDRFLILDDKELYHVGASLKDLGRKCFAFSTMDPSLVPAIKSRL